MRQKLLVVLETVGVGFIVAGISVWSVPAACVTAGVALIAACEVRG